MIGLSLINRLLFLINSFLLIGQLISYLAPFVDPNIFWPIAFFGLLFPIFFLLNLFFLVFWLVQMKRPFWANLIILMIGLNPIGKIIGNAESEIKTEVTNSFSIMSYNVRLFNAYNWIQDREVKEKIFDLFKDRNVDILCIQEFYAPEKLPEIDFKFPVLEGDVVEIGMQTLEMGKTSCTLACDVRSLQADRVVCSIDKMVYVRVNKYGLPKPHGGMNE